MQDLGEMGGWGGGGEGEVALECEWRRSAQLGNNKCKLRH